MDEGTTLADVLERLARLEADNAELRAELATVKGRPRPVARVDEEPGDRASQPLTRRSLLRGAGTAAAATAGLLVVSSGLSPRTAAADEGDAGWRQVDRVTDQDSGEPVQIGLRNLGDPNDATEIWADSENNFVLGAQNRSFGGDRVHGNNRTAVYGLSRSASNGRGVYGQMDSYGAGNFGVLGRAGESTGAAGHYAGVCGDSRGGIGVVGLSSFDTAVLGLNNRQGIAVFGYQTGIERALLGRVDNPDSDASAAHGTTNGNGPGVLGEITKATNRSPAVHGLTNGTGNGVFGESTSTTSPANGVLGIAKGPGNSVYGFKPADVPGDAVVGWARSGTGAFGLSDAGIGVKAQGGRAALLLVPRGQAGPPAGETHERGEVATDANGVLWTCTRAGVPGGRVPFWARVVTSGVNDLDRTSLTVRATGVAIEGASPAGRGGRFLGTEAQVQLAPADRGRPSSGKAGDLFVDKKHDLWFCKGGKSWVKLA